MLRLVDGTQCPCPALCAVTLSEYCLILTSSISSFTFRFVLTHLAMLKLLHLRLNSCWLIWRCWRLCLSSTGCSTLSVVVVLLFVCRVSAEVSEPDSMSVLECVVTLSKYCPILTTSLFHFHLDSCWLVRRCWSFLHFHLDSCRLIRRCWNWALCCGAEVGGWAQCPCQALCAVTLFKCCIILLPLFFFQSSFRMFPSGGPHQLVCERCFQLKVSESDPMSVLECVVTLSKCCL